MGESLRSAIARLRDAWPEHGCGAGDCCVRRPGGQVVGTCRCVRRWKDAPGSQPFYRLLDAARRVVEAPAPEPTTLDEAIGVALDRAQETGVYSEALRRRIASLRLAGPWNDRDPYSRCALSGAVASVFRDRTGSDLWLCSVWPRPGFYGDQTANTPDEGRAWCDAQLREAGWVLIEREASGG